MMSQDKYRELEITLFCWSSWEGAAAVVILRARTLKTWSSQYMGVSVHDV